MKKLISPIIFVTLGVVLAAMIADSGADDRSRGRSVSVEATNSRAEVIREPSDEFQNALAELEGLDSQASKVKVFRSLLGEKEGYGLFREEVLDDIDKFESRYSSSLKQALLETLIQKFTEDDYQSWTEASYIDEGKPTEARSFVDEIGSINSDLGSYLETSALMTFRLSRITEAGRKFVSEKELRSLVGNAKILFKEQASPTRTAGSFIDPDILADEAFSKFLESRRCKEVVAYLLNIKSVNSRRLKLLPSIDLESCDENIYSSLEDFLGFLATKGSLEDRRAYLGDEQIKKLMLSTYEQSPRLQTLQAELFALGAVDSLELGDVKRAESYLEKSLSLADGLNSQKLLARHLSQEYEISSGIEGLKVAELEDIDSDSSNRSKSRASLGEMEDSENEEFEEDLDESEEDYREESGEQEDYDEEDYDEEKLDKSRKRKSSSKKKSSKSLGVWVFILVLGVIFIIVITAVLFIFLNKIKSEKESDEFSYDSGDEDFDEDAFWDEEDEVASGDEIAEIPDDE